MCGQVWAVKDGIPVAASCKQNKMRMRQILQHEREVLVQVVVVIVVSVLSLPMTVFLLLHPITIFVLIFLAFILVPVIAIAIAIVPLLSTRLPSRTWFPRSLILAGRITRHILLPMLPIFPSLPTIILLKLAIITTAVGLVVIIGVSVTTPPLVGLVPPSIVRLPAIATTSIGI
jgi:hypothetical protein